MARASQLALGTAQFGMPYGVSNVLGQVTPDAAAAILREARAAGVDTLDTAIAYGGAEARLGAIGVGEWRVISKLPPLPEDRGVAEWVNESVTGSLQRLGISRLAGLLLHRPQDLLAPRGGELFAALRELQARGTVEKIGISIYMPDELEALLPRFPVQLVQAPFNVLDRRLVQSGWLAHLREAGIEVHARSVFLQGLLLMAHDARPPRFERWGGLWERWEGWLRAEGLRPVEACLRAALGERGISRFVVGVESVAQLRELVAAAEGAAVSPPADLSSNDLDLLNPARWNLA